MAMMIWARRCVAVLGCLFLLILAAISGEKVDTSSDTEFPAIRNAKRAAAGIDNGRCIGLLCRSGAILVRAIATSKLPRSDSTRLLLGSNNSNSSSTTIDGQRIHTIDQSITVGLTGLSCDCKHVLQYLRDKALSFRTNFGTCIPVPQLMESLSSYLHDFTTTGSTRPLAVGGLVAGTSSGFAAESKVDRMAVLVRFECDGAYEYCRAGGTESSDWEEDTAVLEGLMMVGKAGARAGVSPGAVEVEAGGVKADAGARVGVAWVDLTVDEAMTQLQWVLEALHVDDAEQGKEGAGGEEEGGSEGSAVQGGMGRRLVGTDASTDSTTAAPQRFPRMVGNRAHRVVEWAKVGLSSGVGGAVTLSSK